MEPSYFDFHCFQMHVRIYLMSEVMVKSGNFGHQVNSDIHLQTVKIWMRRLIRIFIVYLVKSFFIPIFEI